MADTVKLMTLLRAADGCAVSDMDAHWRGYLDRCLAGKVFTGLDRMVHNSVAPVDVRDSPEGAARGWDGITECWFDRRADADAAIARMRADAGSGYAADHVGVATHLLVDERFMYDSGERPLPVKVIVFFKRRPDITRLEAQAYWQGPHARLGMVDYNATDFLKHYYQNHVLDDYTNADADFDYDGSPEFWMSGMDELMMVGPDSEVMKAIAEDEKNFADRATIVTALVHEVELFSRRNQS